MFSTRVWERCGRSRMPDSSLNALTYRVAYLFSTRYTQTMRTFRLRKGLFAGIW